MVIFDATLCDKVVNPTNHHRRSRWSVPCNVRCQPARVAVTAVMLSPLTSCKLIFNADDRLFGRSHAR
jgi:hypothetical protein